MGSLKLFVIACLAFVATLSCLPMAKGWDILLLLGLLPLEFGLAVLAASKLRRHAMDAIEEQEIKAECKADSVTVTCSRCGRLNSVRTRICPRCEQRL
jgi:hypothetical protein